MTLPIVRLSAVALYLSQRLAWIISRHLQHSLPTNTPSPPQDMTTIHTRVSTEYLPKWSIPPLLATRLDQRSVRHGGSTAHGPFSIVGGLPAPHLTSRLSHLSTLQWCWRDGRTSGVTLPSTRPGAAVVMAKSPLSKRPKTPMELPGKDRGGDPSPRPGMRERERQRERAGIMEFALYQWGREGGNYQQWQTRWYLPGRKIMTDNAVSTGMGDNDRQDCNYQWQGQWQTGQ